MTRKIVLLAGALALAGCTGHVVMTPVADADLNKEQDGILVRRPVQAVEVDQLTQITIPGQRSTSNQMPESPTTSGACTPVETRKLVTIPDGQVWRLHYEPGLLETRSFGLSMADNGVLMSVNTQSSPDAGKTIANVTGTALEAAEGARKLMAVPKMMGDAAPALPACTTAPSLVRIEKITQQ